MKIHAPHRLAAGTLIAVFVMLPVAFFSGVRSAHAGLLGDAAYYVKEYALDSIAWQLKTRVLNSITKSTLNAINTGNNGAPAFVTNLQGLLLDAADTEADRFISQITGNVAIDSPFRDQIAQNVLSSYYRSTGGNSFAIRNPYTLNQVSPDDAAFLRGDFTKGGFQAWFSAVLNPANNPLTAQNLIENELAARIGSAQGQLAQEVSQGQGFLSFRKCDQTAITNNSTSQTTTDLSGQTIQLTTLNLSSHKTCLSNQIETPGSVIHDLAVKTFGTGVDQLVSADELNEIVGAVIGQMLDNIVGGNGLRSVSQPSASTGRSIADQIGDAPTGSSGSGLDSTFLQTLGSAKVTLEDYKQSWFTVQVAAQKARTALSSTTCVPNASALIENQVTPLINEGTAAIGKADGLLNQINDLSSRYTLLKTTRSSQTEELFTLSEQLNGVIAGMPSQSDLDFIAAQAKDTGTAAPASLLTQMNQLAAEAACTP